MNLRKAAEELIEAWDWDCSEPRNKVLRDLIEDLRQALAQPEQEPVGYVTIENISSWAQVPSIKWFKKPTKGPLYTAPPSIEAAVLAEREACAKLCEDNAKEWIDGNNDWCQGQATGSIDCAEAIRARGEK